MTESRKRTERRHGTKHRFDRAGSLVGDEISIGFLECLDCGEFTLCFTGMINGRAYYFPIGPDDARGFIAYVTEALESVGLEP